MTIFPICHLCIIHAMFTVHVTHCLLTHLPSISTTNQLSMSQSTTHPPFIHPFTHPYQPFNNSLPCHSTYVNWNPLISIYLSHPIHPYPPTHLPFSNSPEVVSLTQKLVVWTWVTIRLWPCQPCRLMVRVDRRISSRRPTRRMCFCSYFMFEWMRMEVVVVAYR